MADDIDDSQRTEQPTQKRLSDAEEKGDITQSPEIATLAVIAAAIDPAHQNNLLACVGGA